MIASHILVKYIEGEVGIVVVVEIVVAFVVAVAVAVVASFDLNVGG